MLMQAECELDDVGDPIIGHPLALLIFEGVAVAARQQETLLEMFSADHAKMLWGNRLAVLAQRHQQLGDALAIDPFEAKELSQ